MRLTQGTLVTGTAWLCLATCSTACQSDAKLDTDAPWPVDADTGFGDVGAVAFEDQPIALATQSDEPQIAGNDGTLHVLVAEDDVLVDHHDIWLAPCDDLAVSGLTTSADLVVEAEYANADCGEPAYYDLEWAFPRPTAPGEWTLQVGEATTTFTVD